MEKLQSIQVLRGVAALAVVLCHAHLLPLGAVGVDIFFVLSGFIIGRVMVGRDWRSFLAARAWRIFPIYWICALPWLFLAYAAGEMDPTRTLSSLTLWPFYGEVARPYLRPSWTLCFELLFYLGAALSLATGKGRLVIAAFAACFVANLLWPGPLFGFFGYPLIAEFLAGLAITRLPISRTAGVPLLGIALLVLAFSPASAFSDGAIGVVDGTTLVRLLWWGIPAAFIVYGVLGLESLRMPQRAVLLGDASYSIYLTHMLVTVVCKGWPAVVLSLVLGVAVHLYIEKPLLGLRTKGFRSRPLAAAV